MSPIVSALLEAASLAPSAHNTQPWALRFHEDALEIHPKFDRALTAADADGRDLLHGVGALLENCILTLAAHGQSGTYTCADTLTDSRAVITLRWRPAAHRESVLESYRMIPIRRTSWAAFERRMPDESMLQRLQGAVGAPFRLRIMLEPEKIRAAREIAAVADAALLANNDIAEELRRWLRFSRRDSSWYRDGLNADCMGWSGVEAVVASYLLRPFSLRLLMKLGLLRALMGRVDQQAPFAPLLCLLTCDDPQPSVKLRIDGGRSLQRAWLAAASGGLATHPLSSALDHPPSRERIYALFQVTPRESPINLFRLGYSPKVARSYRLPVEELLA